MKSLEAGIDFMLCALYTDINIIQVLKVKSFPADQKFFILISFK